MVAFNNSETSALAPGPTIVIVGGGFSGAMVAYHLSQIATSPIHLVLVERKHAFGRGIAYSTASGVHFLNVPAGKMSALPDEPEHFLKWAQARDTGVQPGTFVARKEYGDYLVSLLEEASSRPGGLASWARIQGEAVSIHPPSAKEKARVILADGQELSADCVVLALGNAPGTPPKYPVTPFYGSERFIGDPWCAEALESIPADGELLVIGTGLTMVDKVLELKRNGHRGVIHAVSRHGLLPRSHDLSCLPYGDVMNGFEGKTVRGLLRHLRGIIRNGQQDWRSVIDGLRPHTQRIWQGLSREERQRFLRHVQSYWEVSRHRMAPEAAGTIHSLLEKGELVIHPGRIQTYHPHDSGVVVEFREGKTGVLRRVNVSAVVNCSGSGQNFKLRRDPLIQTLRTESLITPDTLGIGLMADPHGAMVDAAGKASGWLYTLGPPLKGLLWETTAVPELRQQAKALAVLLAEKLKVIH